MSTVSTLGKNAFEEATAKGVSLVDFSAEWCGPCKAMAPLIDQLASEFEGRAIVGTVDIDDEQELAIQNGVTAVPTLVVFKDGSEFKRFQGLTRKEELAAALEAAGA